MDEKKRHSKFRLDFEDLYRTLGGPYSDRSFYCGISARPVMCQLWIAFDYLNENSVNVEISGIESALIKFFHFRSDRVRSIVEKLKDSNDVFCGILPEDSAEIRSRDVNIYFRGIGLLSTCRLYRDEFYVIKRD